jgi:hypothetical protein
MPLAASGLRQCFSTNDKTNEKRPATKRAAFLGRRVTPITQFFPNEEHALNHGAWDPRIVKRESTMDKKSLTRSDAFIDKVAFDRLAHDAKQRRALFMRETPQAMLALMGIVALISVAGSLIGIASREMGPAQNEMAGSGHETEAQVNAATDQMERFASLLEMGGALTPEAAKTIHQKIAQPIYDCNRMPCSAPLQHRNYLARAHLKALLARRTLSDQPHKTAAR